ncbi:MAG: hypothetical protein OEV66_07555 [Spirochaetia bacterium]|nr:hypothetical protein [Spirochaetia bacterium]
MIRKTLITLFIFAGFMCSGGNYNTLMVKAEKTLYQDNNPEEASRLLIPNVNRRDQDQLLFMMEAGYMLHMANDYKTSNKILTSASNKAESMYKSISKEIASFITNETGKDYMGEDYERILVNMTLGINYLMLNDYDSAEVEFKKVNNMLEYIQEKSGIHYNINLMALYLSSIAHAAAGELEYAYIDLKKIDEIQPGIQSVGLKLMILARQLDYMDDFALWRKKYRGIVLDPALEPYKNSSELVFVYESGLAPRKQSRGRLLADPEINTLFNAAVTGAIIASGSASGAVSNALVLSTIGEAEHPVPRYVYQKYETASARLEIFKDGRIYKTVDTQLLNDVEKTIKTNFENHYMKIREKMITRLATKVVATLVSKAVAESAASNIGGRRYGAVAGFIIGTLTGIGVGSALFSSEKPDLRCWHTIPANYQAGSLLLPQGSYTGIIKYYNRNGDLVSQKDAGKIIIKPDSPSVLLFRTYD